MANCFHLKINTPFKVYFDDEITQIELCTNNGYIGILHNHIPIVGAIVPGNITIHTKNNQLKKGYSGYGLFSFYKNKLIVVSDTFSFDKITTAKNHQDILNTFKTLKLHKKTIDNFEVYLKKTFAQLKQNN